jgi:hypothetical protein
MADTSTTVKIGVNVDDRSLKKLEQTNRKAWNKAQIKEYERAAVDLETQLQSLVQKQTEISKSFEGVAKGSKQYKQLASDLKSTRREADMVARSLGQVDRLLTRQRREQQRATSQGQAGRGGFVAGLGQGLGVAQYLPHGPGMAARMGGAMLGGGIRRGAGIAAAPFTMPGIGGLAQGLGGIPIVGGFLAGALQQAAGAYQSAVGYDRAAWQNIGYAGGMDAFAAGPHVQKAAMQRAAIMNQARQIDTTAREEQQQAVQENMNLRLAQRAREQRAMHQKIRSGPGAALGALGKEGFGKGLASMPASRVYTWGQVTTPQSDALQASKDDSAIIRTAKAKAARVGANIDAQLPGAGFGVPFGISPTQMQQMFGQFMGARGGRYGEAGATRNDFRTVLAAQAGLGVSAGLSGQYGRLGVAGGGGQNMLGLATVLQVAVAQGLKGSQVPEYLQSLVSLGSRAEKMGVKIDVREFGRETAQLKAAGLQGLQAGRVAGGLNTAAMNLSQRGASNPMDVLLMRAAGYRPEQGAEGYASAMNTLAGGLNQHMLGSLLGEVTQGAQAGGFGPQMQSLMVRRALGKLGVQIGPKQAASILEAYRGGQVPDISALMAAGERGGAAGRLQAGAAGLVGRNAPTTIGAASLEAERIGLGRGAAKWVVDFERNAIKSGQVINNFSADLQKLSAIVSTALTAAQKFTAGGLEGVIKKVVASFLRTQGISMPAIGGQ